jgi:hypothetical protein
VLMALQGFRVLLGLTARRVFRVLQELLARSGSRVQLVFKGLLVARVTQVLEALQEFKVVLGFRV